MISESQIFRTIVTGHQGPPFIPEWTIPADLPYFDGHFPGNPIFPAVGIVDATVYFLRAVLKRPNVAVPHFPIAKFLSPIQPGQTVRIELSPLKENEWQAEWKDAGDQKLLATLRLSL